MPATATDRLYGLSTSLAIKPACRVATTAPITLSGLQTVNGVTLVADDRVLVKDQANSADNGIYIANTSAWSRAPDFDGARDAVDGTIVTITSTDDADYFYKLSATNPVVIGTSALTFVLASVDGVRAALTRLWVTPTDAPWQAKFDGVADDLAAVQACVDWAAANGRRVLLPSGTAMLSAELKLPSNSYLCGAGAKKTLLKLMTTAAMDQNVITNASNDRTEANAGNADIHIEHLGVDGSRTDRYGSASGTFSVASTGGCGIGFSNVQNGYIGHCYSKNLVKHAFDIGATTYGNGSPTYYPPGPSRHIRIEYVESENFGDDGVTTHFSGDIEIRGVYSHDSGNTYATGNSNGVEIDDGSYDVSVIGGYSLRCTKGLQIKGHSTAPAATRVHVFGFTAEACNRNFELRHQGFETSGGAISASAFDVELIACTSINPQRRSNTPLLPRALNVRAYSGVLINGFTCIGYDALATPPANGNEDDEGGIDYATTSLIIFSNNSRNIVLKSTRFLGITGATALIYFSNSGLRNITVEDVRAWECAGYVIRLGGDVANVIIDGVDARTTVLPAPAAVIKTSQQPSTLGFTVRGISHSGYTLAMESGGANTAWPTVPEIAWGQMRRYSFGEPVSVMDRDSSGHVQLWRRLGIAYLGVHTTSVNQRIGALAGSNLMLSTSTGDESTTLVDRWQLNAATGSYEPVTDNSVSFGRASNRPTQLFAVTATIGTSDAREKADRDGVDLAGPDVSAMTDAEIAAARELSSVIGIYKWRDAVAEKGAGARLHVGVTVQKVMAIMASHGLDPMRYGFVCYDEWDEQFEVVEDGSVVQIHRPAGNRYSLRGEELLMFIARGFDARLAALEAA